jgi:hypothetical protein
MRQVGIIAIIVGVISLVLAAYSRVTLEPLGIVPGGLTTENFIGITNTCLLAAIAFVLLDISDNLKK